MVNEMGENLKQSSKQEKITPYDSSSCGYSDIEPLLTEKNLVYKDKNLETYILENKPGIAQAFKNQKGKKQEDFQKVNYWNKATTGVNNPRQEAILIEIADLLQTIATSLQRLESYIIYRK